MSRKTSFPDVLKPVFEFVSDTVFTEGFALGKRPGKYGRISFYGPCRFGGIFPLPVVPGNDVLRVITGIRKKIKK